MVLLVLGTIYVFLGLIFFSCNAYSADDPKGNSKTLGHNSMKGDYALRTVCVDGYKFVIANRYDRDWKGKEGIAITSSISVTQFYEEKNGKALPARCS